MAEKASKYIPFLDPNREGGKFMSEDIGTDTLLATDIAPGAVGNSELAADAVETAKIKDANVTAVKLAVNAVETTKIADANVTTAKIADANVTKDKLATGIKSAYMVVYAGTFTWAGGEVSYAKTVTGILDSDLVVASIKTAPTQAAYLTSVVASADTVTVTLSAANTSNNAVITYVVLRATS